MSLLLEWKINLFKDTWHSNTWNSNRHVHWVHIVHNVIWMHSTYSQLRINNLYKCGFCCFWKPESKNDILSVQILKSLVFCKAQSYWWKLELWLSALCSECSLCPYLSILHTHIDTHLPPVSSLGLPAISALCILSGFSTANLNDLSVDVNHLCKPLQDFPRNEKVYQTFLDSVSCFCVFK